MSSYDFEILSVNQIKGHKIEKTKDYEVKVIVKKDDKELLNEVIRVRKNAIGVYPETEIINKKLKSSAMKKEVTEKLKEYVKKAR